MQALAASDDGTAYARDPTWVPHYYDPFRDTLIFARLPRDAQRALPFLDPRFVKRERESEAFPVSELPAALISAEAGPLNFIFHTGFCCSTLLTRALDIPSVSMGLKEPAVLSSFADYWSNSRRAAGV